MVGASTVIILKLFGCKFKEKEKPLMADYEWSFR